MRLTLLTVINRFVIVLVLATMWAATSSSLHAATWEVGPGKQFSKPSDAANDLRIIDGDTVLISAGIYAGDVCYWTKNNLTITGVGGFSHLASGGAVAGGKGIWVLTGSAITIENIEFSGAACPDLNGAGIRLEGDGLTVRGCYFHDNENGILCGANPTSDVLIERSEFTNNGHGDGQSHNLYIGKIRSLTFRYNYSHHAKIGHCLKSRAAANYIIANRIMDESSGTSSYNIDLPNGGLSYVIGNLIQQGPNSPNSGMIAYEFEGASNPIQHLYLINNTIVNDRSNGTFVAISADVVPSRIVRIENNIFVGPGTPFSFTPTTDLNNLVTASDPLLVNRAGYDYRLQAGSPAINAGADPGSAEGYALLPNRQYVHPLNDQARATAGGAVDIGAYEFVSSLTPPPTVATPANGPTSPVTGTTAGLHVLGGPAGSEAGYTYTWSVVSAPFGGSASFTPNGTNAGRDATMTINRVGTWTVQVLITDPANATSTVSGPITVTVAATFTSLAVSGPATVAPNANATFSAIARDQFAQALASQPTMSWTATGGSVTSAGLFTAGAAVGPGRVSAANSGISNFSDLTITTSAPPAPVAAAPDTQGKCGLGGGVAAFALMFSLFFSGRRQRR